MLDRPDRLVLLALDVGTTNCKASAYDGRGRLLLEARRSYRTFSTRPGWYEQRPADWLRAAAWCLRRAGEQLGEDATRVAGLALSAWGPSLVFLNERGDPLSEMAPTWQDSRSASHGERLLRDVGPEWIGGGIPTTGFPAKLAWALAEMPAIAARAAYAAGVKEVLLAWLTGVVATDPSSGPYAPSWSAEVFAHLGWSTSRLPTIMPATVVAGRLLGGRARQLGLPAGMPVVIGLNDGASATLGSGAVQAGDAVISLGTNGVLRVLFGERPDARRCLDHGFFRYPLAEGLWASGGFVLAGAEALDWFAAAVSPSRRPGLRDRLLAEASAVTPGSDGLIFLPYLVGRGSPHPVAAARGAFVGLDSRHGRGHLVRAVLEGVGFGLWEIALEFKALGWQPRNLMVTGGGARSTLWRRCLAGIFGRPVAFAEGSSGLGAAVVLAVAAGVEPDLKRAVRRLVPRPTSTSADEGAEPIYRERYEAFRQAADRLAPFDDRGGA